MVKAHHGKRIGPPGEAQSAGILPWFIKGAQQRGEGPVVGGGVEVADGDDPRCGIGFNGRRELEEHLIAVGMVVRTGRCGMHHVYLHLPGIGGDARGQGPFPAQAQVECHRGMQRIPAPQADGTDHEVVRVVGRQPGRDRAVGTGIQFLQGNQIGPGGGERAGRFERRPGTRLHVLAGDAQGSGCRLRGAPGQRNHGRPKGGSPGQRRDQHESGGHGTAGEKRQRQQRNHGQPEPGGGAVHQQAQARHVGDAGMEGNQGCGQQGAKQHQGAQQAARARWSAAPALRVRGIGGRHRSPAFHTQPPGASTPPGCWPGVGPIRPLAAG